MNCPRCHVEAMYSHNGNYYYHCCGWKRQNIESAEIASSKPLVSVKVQSTNTTQKTSKKRKRKPIDLWNMGTRLEYLNRYSLTEEDIFIDELGKEYWVKEIDTEEGEVEIETVYVPIRYKNKKVNSY